MRVLRFFALLLVVLIVFIATPTFEWQPLAALLPADYFADSTLFTWFHRWVTQDLSRFALLITGCAGLTFGLLTIPWPYPSILYQPPSAHRLRTSRRIVGSTILLAALASGGTGAALYFGSGTETALLHGLWVGSILLLLIAAGVLTNRRQQPLPQQPPSQHQSLREDASTVVHPAPADRHPVPVGWPTLPVPVGWPTLLTMLLFAFLLCGWNLTSYPATVDDTTVQVGLAAHLLNRSNTVTLFAPLPAIGVPEQPLFALALTPTAFWARFSHDLLFGTRTAGLLAALLATLGIWLVAIELFTRPVSPPGTPHDLFAPIEDNGQSLAALATLLFVANMGVLYFSRTPIVLTATAWGILGCWALLRGIRLEDRLAMSLSGVLIGLGLIFHSSALTFALAALLWWLGFGAVRLGLLPHAFLLRTQKTMQSGYTQAISLRFSDFLLWSGALLLVIVPFLPPLIQAGRIWAGNLLRSPTVHLAALVPNFAPPVPTYPAPLFNLILLPLIPLAIGVMIFNLDRRQGWLLSTWLLSALGVATLLPQQAIQWDHLLPLIPISALAMTFALDRLRVTLLRVGVRWLQHFLNFFLLGLALWVAFHNGTTYYTFARTQSDTISSVGRALRARASEQPAVVLQGATERPILAPDDPELLFLTNGNSGDPTGPIQFATQVPEGLASGTLLLVLPEENYWIPAIETAYPNGLFTVMRDRYANPLLYLYTIAEP
ncbi:MAG: hypothetical protein KDE19_12435 [Caldilineaceae bacterium]|nr:hypothetical protein [Caldilineaceae bacterium]